MDDEGAARALYHRDCFLLHQRRHHDQPTSITAPGSGGRPAAMKSPRYVLWMLAAMSALSFMDRQILAVIIEPVKAEFALSDLQIGIVTGFGFALTFSMLGIPLGRVADQHDRRHLIALCRGLGGAVAAFGAAAGGFWQLALTRTGGALSEAGSAPASMSMIADLFSPQQRSRAISVFGVGASAGSLLALMLGGWLAQRYGWRFTLAAVGGASLLVAVLFRLTVHEPVRAVAPALSGAGAGGDAMRQIWRNPVARALIVAAACVLVSAYSFGAWNFTYLVRYHHLSLAQAGLVSGTAAIGSVFGGLASGMLTDHLARRDLRWQIGVPIAGVACALPVSLVYFMVPPGQTGVLTALVVLFAFFIASWVAPTYAALSFVVATQRRATANAMVLLAGSVLGSGASPILIGWLSDLLAPVAGVDALRYAMAISMGLLVVALGAFAVACRAYPAAHRSAAQAAQASLVS